MNLSEAMRRVPMWHGRSAPAPAAAATAIPTGHAALDAQLGGGWPQSALSEILYTHEGIGELRLLMPALARVTRQKRWLAFIAPPRIPYAAALAYAGLDLSRVLLVRPSARRDVLWAVEQALRAGTCGAVVAWAAHADFNTLHRLQLAAEAGKAWGVLFRPGESAQSPTPAALRVQLEPWSASGRSLVVHVLKRQGEVAFTRLVLDVDHALARPAFGAVAVQRRIVQRLSKRICTETGSNAASSPRSTHIRASDNY